IQRQSVFAILLTAAIVVMAVMVAVAIDKHPLVNSELRSKFAMFGVLFVLAGMYEFASKRVIVGNIDVWNDRRLIWTISTGCWLLCGIALVYKGVF
ncbi:MAG: hypothetical protein QW568_02200, partial [Candidatus Anstonellaceae archaeon]